MTPLCLCPGLWTAAKGLCFGSFDAGAHIKQHHAKSLQYFAMTNDKAIDSHKSYGRLSR